MNNFFQEWIHHTARLQIRHISPSDSAVMANKFTRIDGESKTLAYAFKPGPRPYGRAGDIEYDKDEPWSAGVYGQSLGFEKICFKNSRQFKGNGGRAYAC